MKNSKLILLLSKLSPKELNRLREFVDADFFNQHKGLKRLCNYLLDQAPEFSEEVLQREKVYAQVEPGTGYNDDRLNNLLSDLLQLVYAFFTHLELEKRPDLQGQMLTDRLLELNLPKHLRHQVRRQEQLLDRRQDRSFDYFNAGYHLHQHLDRFELGQQNRRFSRHLQQESDHIDRYFLIQKFRLACEMSSRNSVIRASYHCDFMAELVNIYEERKYLQQIPALQTYYCAWRMLEQRSDATHFYELKQLLQKHHPLFPLAEQRLLYNYALNFCISRINSGESEYYRETLDLYQSMLDSRIIFVRGILSQWAYKNIITTGIRLQDFTWTENFIHQYKEYLPLEERPNAVAYNLAALYYARSDYKNALLQLQDVEFTDASYHTGAKIIQLKSYYELDESEAFYSLIEAFKKYLSRNRQLSDYRKKANMNFLRLARQIYQFKNEYHLMHKNEWLEKHKKLNLQVETIDPIANKEWLKRVLGLFVG
ncbi:MAG: hypothetical protein DHS20C18_26570 [Saprospiraceae bacterium]|nr:MAG: hypothetical protein DHS20C18_26570 [Saprospiraceae bacterium]